MHCIHRFGSAASAKAVRCATSSMTLSSHELQALLEAIGYQATHRDLRDAVTLVLNTGLRISELRNLRWSDVELSDRQILVRLHKSNRVRLVPFNEAVGNMLSARRAADPDSEFVFGDHPDRLLRHAARQLVEVSPEAVGRKLSFHTVRRTFIGTLINSGMQLISIATLLGASPKAVAEVR